MEWLGSIQMYLITQRGDRKPRNIYLRKNMKLSKILKLKIYDCVNNKKLDENILCHKKLAICETIFAFESQTKKLINID